jgi:CheY-like chemotaxis protein
MGYAPDGQGSDQLIAEAQHLVARSREHEHRLQYLATSLEAQGTRAAIPSSADLLELVRHLCVAAREQHQRMQRLVTGMLGDSALGDAPRARVLVVDDSDDSRELAAVVLEAAEFHVITARNGLEGVVAAHSEHPAVVLMDVTMPVLDGIEAARLMKASERTRHMKILAHTARPEFHSGPLTRLFVDVLPKPTTPEALVRAVRRLIDAPAGD